MKRLPILLLALAALATSSCIKDEAPNIEVDIVEITSPDKSILNVAYNSSEIDIYAVPGTDLSDMPLEFTLSPGATIAPAPEDVTDYSEPRVFTVTSEDRQWHKDYIVSVRFNDLPLKFGFETWRQPEKKRYMIPVETSGGADLNIWACGNEAFHFLTTKDDDFTAFPTQPTGDAHSGMKAAKLVTILTGQIDKPIASGNLFIGNFDGSKRDPKESTKFGLPFSREPLRFTGAYKYKSGGLTIASGEKDRARIQAVLYLTDESTTHLDGHTLHTSPNVVARAEADMLADTGGDGFATFDLPFIYSADYDTDLAARGRYNLAIICSASRNGDSYDGAPGSTLIVDDLEIICR